MRPAEQFSSLDRQAQALRLGMWAFLGSEALLFAGLFALYASYRVAYTRDFSEAVGHNLLLLGSANTLILITSSFTIACAIQAVRTGRLRRVPWLVFTTVGLGALFLVLKFFEYGKHFAEGILPGSHYRFAELTTFGARQFFTLYYVMTGLHALHVTAGLAALAWIGFRSARCAYTPARHVPLELAALSWHLVDVIWIFLWPLLYLAR